MGVPKPYSLTGTYWEPFGPVEGTGSKTDPLNGFMSDAQPTSKRCVGWSTL